MDGRGAGACDLHDRLTIGRGDEMRHTGRFRVEAAIPQTGYRLIAQPVATVADSPANDEKVQGPWDRPSPNGPRGPEHGRYRSARLAAGAAVLFPLTAGWWLLRPIQPTTGMPVAAPGASLEPPVIAVLPFENLAPDPAQDYFADGVTEDLITDLSKLSGLHVLARQSVQPYRGSGKTESETGSELGARYLVRGSTRRDGDSLRVNVRLVDVADGVNRWAERYDRQLAGIFQVQEEIGAVPRGERGTCFGPCDRTAPSPTGCPMHGWRSSSRSFLPPPGSMPHAIPCTRCARGSSRNLADGATIHDRMALMLHKGWKVFLSCHGGGAARSIRRRS